MVNKSNEGATHKKERDDEGDTGNEVSQGSWVMRLGQ